LVTNAELSRALGEDIDDFVSNTLGIKERRYCAPTNQLLISPKRRANVLSNRPEYLCMTLI
jgi:hypothetical protein